MIDGRPDELHQQFDEVWGNPRGWRAATIVNHTRIGLLFLLTGLGFFIFGGLLAMLIRAQLALPDQAFMDADIYNQVFTMHGTVMMFLFAVPMMEGLAVYLIPKMLGARDLVFPRLSALGYWCYLFGGLILAASLFLELAPDAGWFMYTPLSSLPYSPGVNSDFWLLGITFVEISAVTAAVELVVAILRARAPGMTLQRMPLYAWYILTMAMMIVLGFPPLILGSILLELERAAGMAFFDVARGGDPILWQHLFWLFGHPEVYIIFLPAAGLVSTMLPVFARRPIVGYRWVVVAVLTTGFISFALWVHHMFTVGIPHLAQAFFSAASMLVAIPTGVQVFSWLATLWLGRPVYHVPMLWLFGFLVIFVAGGLTGVMLALVPFNWQVHDTQFVVAHLHYVLVGGMFFPLVAAVYYWLPHFSGRMPSANLGRWGFWLVFVGFNVTFLVMHWTGLLGMPRRAYTYAPGLGWDVPNLVSSIGSFVMAIGIAAVLVDVLLHFRFGVRAAPNPWHADTLEWATRLPPAAYNFISLPTVDSRYPLWDRPELAKKMARGEEGLAAIAHGRRETWGTDAVTGEVREIIHLPGNTWLPFAIALVLSAVCIGLLVKAYAVAGFASFVAAILVLRWSWENGARAAGGTAVPGSAGDPPLHWRTHDGPGRWGMSVTLLADGALYAALLFGWFYLWTVAPQWQVPAQSPLDGPALLANGVLLTVATLWLRRVVAALRRGSDRRLRGQLAAIAALGLLQSAHLLWLMHASDLAVKATAHDAVIAIVLGYALFHCVLAGIVTALQAWRVHCGHVDRAAPYEPIVLGQLWYYNLGVVWSAYFALVLFPSTWGGG
ncbi:cytochrome c oxidase subunit I [Azoarcus sp. PA01]|nr:cytochrome c oxidase subunit I [Azoarcus sp. PA01]